MNDYHSEYESQQRFFKKEIEDGKGLHRYLQEKIDKLHKDLDDTTG
jgi:hypothetical protein